MNSNLTELENRVLEAIKQGDWFDDMPSECIGNLVDSTGLTSKVLRGVLSSLLQKELIEQGEYPNGITAFQFKQN